MGYLLEQSDLSDCSWRELLLRRCTSLYSRARDRNGFAAATGIVGSSVTLLGVMAARR